MKLRIELDGDEYLLHLHRNGQNSEWRVTGAADRIAISGFRPVTTAQTVAGNASVEEISPGVFSVLLDERSITVRVAENGNELDIWAGNRHYSASIADARDSSGSRKRRSAAGPIEVRAQMPGKIIKLLVETGAAVQAGQGVVVVEAMKMQNEMKSPKDGRVTKIRAAEGATVAAGETLVVIE